MLVFSIAFLLGGPFKLGVDDDRTESILGFRLDFEWRKEERFDTAAITERINDGFFVLLAEEEEDVEDVVDGVVDVDSIIGCCWADNERIGNGVSGVFVGTSGEGMFERIGGDFLNDWLRTGRDFVAETTIFWSFGGGSKRRWGIIEVFSFGGGTGATTEEEEFILSKGWSI